MENFEEKVLFTVRKYKMLDPHDKVLVAVSGGVDSLTLLAVLRKIPFDLDLSVFHLNHGLRPEAKKDAELVAEICRKWSIPHRIININVQETKGTDCIQAAARKERYRLLEEVAAEQGATRIALGHQADDQVETMLMRFINGAGPEGMAGIPPVRGRYIRPLIEVSRAEILEYARHSRLVWAEDASNQKTDYFRNKIRHCLLPLLEKEYQPQLRKRLMATASLFQEWEEYLHTQVGRVLADWQLESTARLSEQARMCPGELFSPDDSKSGSSVELRSKEEPSFLEEIRIPAEQWSILSPALKRAVFRGVVFKIQPGLRLEYKHSELFLDLLAGANGRRIILPGDLEVRKEHDQIIIKPVKQEVVERFFLPLNIPGCTELPFGQGVITASQGKKDLLPKDWREVSPAEAFFDYDRVQLPLYLRPRKLGERFTPLGLAGTKKLKDFFSDLKVPRKERDRIPLVVDAEDRVLWVVGMRPSEVGRISERTEHVLYLKYTR
ncbi:MAG TPA: tRNA lysidine(34) synthetase TilS [Bacillota bacterium]